MTTPPGLTPILVDAETLRKRIHGKFTAALTGLFPLDLKGRTLELSDVAVHAKEFSPDEQKSALLTRDSLHEIVKGTMTLRDGTGKVVDVAKNFTLAHLPYLTERHTLILDGNEYQVANMIRRKPGVYTQRHANGELSTTFNLSKGTNFDLTLNPEKGTIYLEPAGSATKVPFYPILRALGVPHEDIARHWGQGVAETNRKEHGHQIEASIAKLYPKLLHASMIDPNASHETRLSVVKQRLDATSLNPDVAQHTVGIAASKVTSPLLLAASKKLFEVHEGRREVDDSDSLAYKTYHSLDDFLAERLRLASRSWSPKAKIALSGKDKIRGNLKPSPFTDTIKSFITSSPLVAVPQGINPIELIDHAVKVTALGEGGIPSERAIPFEARLTHPTHYGVLDPIRTPESSHAGVDIRATISAHRDDKGNLYTPLHDVKAGKVVYVKAGDLLTHVVAFPHQEIKGEVDALVNGQVQRVAASRVTHQALHVSHSYSPATTLIPFLHNVQGNRAIMGSKMQTQALPLVDREAPLIQVAGPEGDRSFENIYGHMVVPTAPVSGTVERIHGGYVWIRPHTEKGAGLVLPWDKTAAPRLKSKTLGDLTFKIDRPKGYEKTWDSGRSWVYPVDYGYFPKHKGEDEEGLDAFVGDEGEDGIHESFLKLKKDDSGKMVPDETKFLLGITDHERDEIYAFYGDEVSARTAYEDLDGVKEAIKRFSGKKKTRYQEKTASSDEGLVKVPYQTNFPFPSKTYLHHTLEVKPGDRVEQGQRLADSNYTRQGTLALGKNLRVAYMPYYGWNSNDAVVISEGCAKKLTSEHMYREIYPLLHGVELSIKKHQVYYGAKYVPTQYAHLDVDGVIKKGAKINPQDFLVVGLVKNVIQGVDAMLGKISKSLLKPYREAVLQWNHSVPGEVIEVVRSANQIAILIKTQEQMQIGDKLSNRFGGKGVVAHIVPDHEMIQDQGGKPVDLIMTSAGIVSRINPGQTVEAAAGKVAEKLGRPIHYDNAAGHNAVQWAEKLLKDHDVKFQEKLYDPLNKRHISGPDGKGVAVGRAFIFKLFKSTDTNFAGHGVGPYDINEQPLKTGGDESAKGLGKMEFDALLAHNARNILNEAANIRGQKNDEFWKAIQLGQALPNVKPSFAFNKFKTMLEGVGLRLEKRGSKFKLLPMTDRDILARSAGEIENKKTVVAKNLKPEAGGLFDLNKTGGPQGTLYSHISLHDAMPNPVFEEPIRRLLGLTQKSFEDRLKEHGGSWFKSELKKIDVDTKITSLRTALKTATGTDLNNVVKQIKYLEALKKENLLPHEAYVLNHVPVIPPIFRPITPHPTDPGQLMIADANKLYGHLIETNKTLKETVLQSDLSKHRHELYKSLSSVFGTDETSDEELRRRGVKGFIASIAGQGSPKGGFFQRKLMKRTQDVSGRGTAVPDGNLHMDAVGIPEDMLWKMLDKLVLARLVRNGYPALQAREMMDKRHHVAREALLLEIKERPVLLNRAPTLHRYGIVAAYAQPVQGKTIRVNPFIEKGMNLDYDGDTLQIHAPVTPGGVEDAKKMLTSQLLLSDQFHNKLYVFPQHEAIMGATRALSQTANSAPVRFFKSADEVRAAYRRGDLRLDDKIEIRP